MAQQRQYGKIKSDDLEKQKRSELMKLLQTTETNEGLIPTSTSHAMIFLADLEDAIEEAVTPEVLSKLKKIMLSIKKNGMTYREACIIHRCDPDLYYELAQTVPAISKLVEVSMLEFKEVLLSVLSTKARDDNDEKLATYLLERRFADEFDPGVKKLNARALIADDPVTTVITFIQQSKAVAPVHPGAAEPKNFKEIKEAELVSGNDLLDNM